MSMFSSYIVTGSVQVKVTFFSSKIYMNFLNVFGNSGMQCKKMQWTGNKGNLSVLSIALILTNQICFNCQFHFSVVLKIRNG